MPVQIQGPGATQSLRRQFEFRGRLIPRLDETISPVAVVSDTSQEMPPGILRRVWGAAGVGAVAAEQPWVRLDAPPRVLCLLQKLIIGSSTAQECTAAVLNIPSALAVTGSGAAQYTDGRVRDNLGNATPSVTLNTGNDPVAIAAPFFRFNAPLLPEMREYDVEIPFGGRAGAIGQLILAGNVVNTTLRVGLVWTEYPGVQAIL